jgi:hypothetical protein
MAKQDVLDAINATIAPNNIKGITAESLNNVLTMMAENAGEGGGGDGALRVIVPELTVLGGIFLELGEISPASWEEGKSFLEAEYGDALSEYDAAVNASFAHNANVAQQILAKAKAGQGVSVVLDQTPYYPAALNFDLQVEPDVSGVIEDWAICGVQPAALFMQYMNVTPEDEAMMGGDVFDCVLAPTGNTDFDGMSTAYPSNMLIFLNLDGSLTFTPIEEEQPSSGSGVVFYTTLSGEITEEQKEKNVEAFSKYAAGIPVSVIVTAEIQATYHPFVTGYNQNKDGASGLSFITCSFPIKKSDGSYAAMLFYEDGSVVMQME